MKHFNFYEIKTALFVGLFLVSIKSFSQDNPITTTTTTAIQATQQNVENSTKELDELKSSYESLKAQAEKLAKENESIRNAMSAAEAETVDAQRKLYESNYSLITTTLADIEKVRSQIKSFGHLIDVAITGTLITGLNSPTNSDSLLGFRLARCVSWPNCTWDG